MKRKYYILLIVFLLILNLSGCSKDEPLGILKEYNKLWVNLDFKSMYEEISNADKTEITQEDFVNTYNDFYSTLGVDKVQIELTGDQEQLKQDIKFKENVYVPIKVTLSTKYGEKTCNIDVPFIKEQSEDKWAWRLNWDYNMIYEGMVKGDVLRQYITKPVRGEILDRNEKKLAENGEIVQVGIVQGRLGDMKDEIIKDISDTFGITHEYIQEKLSQSWVKDDTFVDILDISKSEIYKIEKIHSKNNGATYKIVKDRVYPYKDVAAHLTGYMGYINEEELLEIESQGFTQNDKVGRTGLEKIFDEQLRGIPGEKVAIVSESGEEKTSFYEQKMINGKDLKLNIDIDLQTNLYNQMKGEMGTATCMNYKTGEILALVSSPSYDPNQFILGISTEALSELENDVKKPLLNRFSKIYVPGSSFKPITTAIALSQNKVNGLSVDVKGLKWQKNSSWGSYYITRVTDPKTPVDLEKAMIYSDNIYFGQLAMQIGDRTFIEKAKDFGIGTPLDIRYGVEDSQLVSGESISDEVLLADTGYGQGEVLVNILNLPKSYTPFVNEGNIIEPVLVAGEEKPESKNIISKDVANEVFNLLTKVVEDKNGTGHEANISGKTIAGKTGTAEINDSKDLTQKKELGWFVAIDKNDQYPYITAMMIEDVQDRGGSHYVVPKVKEFIKTIQ